MRDKMLVTVCARLALTIFVEDLATQHIKPGPAVISQIVQVNRAFGSRLLKEIPDENLEPLTICMIWLALFNNYKIKY